MSDYIDIVFAKSDDPNPDFRFVEVEDASGHSINAGEWIDRGNGLWALRVQMCAAPFPEAGTTEYGSWILRAKDDADQCFSWLKERFKWCCRFEQNLRELAARPKEPS
jgi:hypothetical protein